MKKLFMSTMLTVAAFSLAACSDSATPLEGTTNISDVALEEVFNKAMERQESLESMKSSMEMNQTMVMSIDDQEMEITSSTNAKMSLTAKPLTLFMEGTMSMAMGSEDTLDMPIKMYFTEADGIYMNDMMGDGWVKLPSDLYEETLAQMGANVNTTEQLEQLKPFLDDFTFEQSDDTFILTLNAKGDKFNELILEQVQGSLGDSLEIDDKEELLKSVDFEKAKYVVIIDKKTYDTTKIVLDLNMTLNVEGTSSKVNTQSTINFSDFNKVNAITIPEEVLNNAEESI